LALELAEQKRHDSLARPGRRADLEPTAQLAFLHAGHLVLQLLLEHDQALGAAVEALPGLRRLDATARAVE
jgi:hypothetical protein